MCVAGGPADHIYIKNRKGFVAVAVEEGVDIVPVYHFGNTQVGTQAGRVQESPVAAAARLQL